MTVLGHPGPRREVAEWCDLAWSALRDGVEGLPAAPSSSEFRALVCRLAKALGVEGAAEPQLAPEGSPPPPTGSPVVESEAMQGAVALGYRYACSPHPLLLTGPTGGGKSRLVKAIHRASGRPGKEVVVNAAGLTCELLRSELFGHKRGAFTGATNDRDGAFFAVPGGTVFLDEIGELDLRAQAALLVALDERAARPLGSDAERAFDIRLIVATNRDLAAEVAAGRFREDLYWRLSVLQISVPGLRERPEDVPGLAAHLLDELGHPAAKLTGRAMGLLQAHPWRGGIRELRSVLVRACADTGGCGVIDASDLVLDGMAPAAAPAVASSRGVEELGGVTGSGAGPSRAEVERALERARFNLSTARSALGVRSAGTFLRLLQQLGLLVHAREARARLRRGLAVGRGWSQGVLEVCDGEEPAVHSEAERLWATLVACGLSQRAAAGALGVDRRTVRDRLERYGLLERWSAAVEAGPGSAPRGPQLVVVGDRL